MGKCNFTPIQALGGERGFTLLEGMLAAVILGIGLLGMAAMQGAALVRNVDANELTRVTTLASDMLERIQFNRRNVAQYNGINTISATNCAAINATAQPQARGDCLLWDSLVDNTNLENIQGRVDVDVNPIPPAVLGQRRVAVTMTWMGSMKSDSSVKRSRTIIFNRVVSSE